MKTDKYISELMEETAEKIIEDTMRDFYKFEVLEKGFSLFGSEKFNTNSLIYECVGELHPSFKEVNANVWIYHTKREVLKSCLHPVGWDGLVPKLHALLTKKEAIMTFPYEQATILHFFEFNDSDLSPRSILFIVFCYMYILKHAYDFDQERLRQKALLFSLKMLNRLKEENKI